MSTNTVLASAPLTTTGFHIKATGTTLGNSLIWDNGTNVGIGNTNTSYTLDVSGSLRSTTSAYFATTSGTVGIGTTSATSPLSIYYPSTSAEVNYIKMEMPSWGGSTNFKKNIIWHDSGNIVGAIGMSFASNQTYMDFHSFYNTAPTTSTIMRIQGNGNIGIGTTSPTALLQIQGAQAGVSGKNLTISYNGTYYAEYTEKSITAFNNELTFGTGTGGTEKMRIVGGGNVGIGTGTPVALLDVYGGNQSIYKADSGVGTAGAGIWLSHYTPTRANLSGAGIFSLRDNGDSNYHGLLFKIHKTATATDAAATAMAIASTGITTVYNTLVLGSSSFVGNIQWGTSGYGTSGYDAGNGKFTWQSSAGATAGTVYYSFNADGFGARMTIANNGNVVISGALSKASGSFRIEHPLESLSETHQLVHSFIEGPQADLIYRGKLTLVKGKAQANIDEVSTMTEGTFEALCREVQCFTTNESGWDLVKGKVIGNIIYIESQNENSTDEISWMVIGERKDKHMMDTDWTDENGKIIVEPLKPIEPSEPITN